jgi:polyphosphate glucokinase
MAATNAGESRRFDSALRLTPQALVERVREETRDWEYDVVSIGYPGRMGPDGPAREPKSLGCGWIGFDFAAAFGRPVRVVNDAVLQALGAYEGGRMLFLGLGTGLGSAVVSEYVVMPLELGNLPFKNGTRLLDVLGRKGREHLGHDRWQQAVAELVPALRDAFAADYAMLGGGNARLVDPLPPDTRRGGNEDAFAGGIRLWDEMIEPHDRQPSQAWRVVR